MKNNLKPLALLIFIIVLSATPLLAQENAANSTRTSAFKIAIIVGGAVIAIASAAGAFSQAKTISSALEGVSRNPGAAAHIRFVLIFGLVMIETLVIYALLISIIILMVQWGKYA